MTTMTTTPPFGSPEYGCIWNQCRRPGRPYQNGVRCPDHTSRALRGLPEIPPGPGWPRDREPELDGDGEEVGR